MIKNITVTLTPEENIAMSAFAFTAVMKYPDLFLGMDKEMQNAFRNAVSKFADAEDVILFNEELENNL